MNFKLVDSGWGVVVDKSLRADRSRTCLRIICPFIKERAAKRLLQNRNSKKFQVITRYDLEGFRARVSDISALRMLLNAGAQIRGIRNLHAKVYLVGEQAIVTSANLTEQALNRNHEFGFTSDDQEIVSDCHSYFGNLWDRAGEDLTLADLEDWETSVAEALASGTASSVSPHLEDFGADVGFSAEASAQPEQVNSSEQGFVKFMGEGRNRLEQVFLVLEEVKEAECHWACCYPKSKKPKQVRDGALMFMGRLVDHPNDVRIFGRAVGMKYQEGRDDATAEDIARRGWKAKWSRYIRVDDANAEFVNGTLADGVSLKELMNDLGSRSFASTMRHLKLGKGNTNPRTAYSRQAHVELTPEAIVWLNDRLDQCFARHGKIPQGVLAKLGKPTINRLGSSR